MRKGCYSDRNFASCQPPVASTQPIIKVAITIYLKFRLIEKKEAVDKRMFMTTSFTKPTFTNLNETIYLLPSFSLLSS